MSKNTAKSNRGKGNHRFAQIPRADIPRSAFDRSRGLKTTLAESGVLYPIFADEVLPGDTMNVSAVTWARMATLLHPVMDNMKMTIFWFAVPNRLVWDNWAAFMGEKENPDDETDYLVPSMVIGSSDQAPGDLHDHMGIPTNLTQVNLRVNSLHHRAYSLIWNEWFRSQDLQDSLTVPKGDGPDFPGMFTLQKRGKRHDYFTSCLPFPQKGPAVELPIGEFAPLVTTGDGVPSWDMNGVEGHLQSGGDIGGEWNAGFTGTTQLAAFPASWNDPALQVDLASATAVNVNELRLAFQVQKMYERDARGGTRLTEIIRSHFGVVSPDSRLQRPEYLGGGSVPVVVNTVPQTTQDLDVGVDTPLGNLAAYGTSGGSGNGFSKSFTEHCVVLGLACFTADLNYQQGLQRMFSRQSRFDFYWPALQALGEQAVLNKEIWANGSNDVDNEVFGYQERWAEYRYGVSQISGAMRSDHPQSLDTWHLAQDFETRPMLNEAFIEENPPTDRVIAVPSEDTWLLDAWFDVRHIRPMPTYSVPGLVDHF